MSSYEVCISQPYSDALRYFEELINRNQFHQSETEQIIVLILSPFVYISAIINMSFFLRGKKRTEPPADILIFVTIFGTIRMTSYLAGSSILSVIKIVYDSINPPGQLYSSAVPASFSDFCSGTGFMNVMCEVAHFVYNVVFCVYYVVKIRNPLKLNSAWIKDNKEIHLFCLVVIIGATLIFYLTNLIGVSILGVCGYRFGEGLIYIDIILTSSYFLTTLVSSVFFLRYLRLISRLEKATKIYFKYYFKYLVISSLVYLIGVVSLVVVTVECLLDEPDIVFDGLVIVCNVSRLISPIMVLGVLAGHPELRLANFLRYFAKICKYKRKGVSPEQIPEVNNRTSFYEKSPSSLKNRTTIMIELTQLNNPHRHELDYLSRIKDRNKACLLNTILGCLALEEIEYLEKLSFLTDVKNDSQQEEKLENHPTSIRIEDLRLSALQFEDSEEIYGWNFNETHEFELNHEIIEAFNQIFTEKIPTLNLKFISFSSSVFKKLQKKERLRNLYEKILPSNNEKQILENVDNDGGRGGQFFFFNFDKTIIIKTITNAELGVLKERLEAYYLHFENNHSSFIVKILGLYKAVNPETEEEISFMLMGNIVKNIPKKYILKSYDMKGSTYQRQVLKNEEIRESNSIETSKTLKDIDFHILEGKIHISPEDSEKIKKTISEDVAFLCSQGLIDYSLIVLKINYKKFREEENDIKIDGLKMYNSTKEEGIVYVFGIIDYLETWNIRKMGEKWYKSILHKEESISSQDPQFYAQRFMKTLISTILP